MNQVTLSKDLGRIETEIQFYKEKAGESIWEIGRRLNHVKTESLMHGQFQDWVEKNLDMNIRTAQRFMKISNELPKTTALSHLGVTALELIAALPGEEREKKHEVTDGETKAPDEMTVRELQELKKRLQEKDTVIEKKDDVIKQVLDNSNRFQKSAIELQKENERLKTQEPKIKIVEKEVVHPHINDLRSDNQQLSEALRKAKSEADAAAKRNIFLEKQINEMYEERKEVNEKSQRFDELTEGIRKLEGQYDHNQEMAVSHKRVLDTIRDGNQLLDKLAGLIYATDIEILSGNDMVVRELNKLMGRVEWWLNDMNKKIDSTTILEGEIIYDK